MEQKDYLLKEIEKIGIIIQSIINTISGRGNKETATIENKFDITNEILKKEFNFDFEKFIKLDDSESAEYLGSWEGFNTENIEKFVDIISLIAKTDKSINTKILIERAIFLLEYCNRKDKTFSFERESKITEHKALL